MTALEISSDDLAAMGRAALDFAVSFHAAQQTADARAPGVPAGLVEAMLAPPPEAPDPEGFAGLLARIGDATVPALATTTAGYLAYIPGGGIPSAGLADYLACTVNRFVNLAAGAPAFVAAEVGILAWLASEFGLPAATSGGLLTSGGSLSLLSAVVAARETKLGEDAILDGTFYCSEHTHHAVAKAARLAGLPRRALREVACDEHLRMDVGALSEMIVADRNEGRRPFLVIATAGTTNTGTVDPLDAVADVAASEGLWSHADGAYGGVFQLTDRGRARLHGIDRYDSITLDPHKGLFLPYGTGILLVRDVARLEASHDGEAPYLQDVAGGRDLEGAGHQVLPDFASRSPELSRDNRGLRVWLPLHLHGISTFREALDEKLDLAERLAADLRAIPGIEVPWDPDLTVVAFRAADDVASRRLLGELNDGGRVYLSSTVVGGRFTLRACILSFRTHADRVDDLVIAVRAFIADGG